MPHVDHMLGPHFTLCRTWTICSARTIRYAARGPYARPAPHMAAPYARLPPHARPVQRLTFADEARPYCRSTIREVSTAHLIAPHARSVPHIA
eukprot:2388370-Rhodomonas_salina.1